MVFLYGFIFSAILGTTGHFLYKFFNNDSIIGFLFSKNENLYQHLKLGFTPILLWMIVEKFVLINNDNLITINGIGFLSFFLVVSLPYFIVNKFFHKNIPFINISSFYFALITHYFSTFLLYNSIFLSKFVNFIGISSFILVISSYFLQNLSIKKRSDVIHQ